MLAGATLPGYTETTDCYGVTMSATNSSITFCNAWHLSTTVAGALSPTAAAKRHFTIGDHGCATLWVVARMSHSYIQNLICCTHSPIMASGLRQRCRRPCIRTLLSVVCGPRPGGLVTASCPITHGRRCFASAQRGPSEKVGSLDAGSR